MSSIFGGNTGMTYEDVQRKRKVADQLMRGNGAPRNVGEGLNAIGQALLARSLNKKADKRDAELREQFNTDFAEVAPNQQGLADLANSPYAGKDHRGVISALMKGTPNYARGTAFHPGGQAVVGENGPEVLNLPRGAQVTPANTFQPGNAAGDAPQAFQKMTPEQQQNFMALGPEQKQQVLRALEEPQVDLNQYDPASQERLQEPGADTAPAPMDMREMIPQEDAMLQGGGGDPQVMGGEGDDVLRYGDAKLTGDQSKSITYYRRGFGSNQVLSDPKMAEALTQYTDTFAGNFGSIGRKFQDADFQVAKRAADEFLAAVLRKDTGAAITNQEFEIYGPMYLPQPGDKPELLAAKSKAREEALIGIEMGLGTAAGLAAKSREELGANDVQSDEDFLKELGL